MLRDWARELGCEPDCVTNESCKGYGKTCNLNYCFNESDCTGNELEKPIACANLDLCTTKDDVSYQQKVAANCPQALSFKMNIMNFSRNALSDARNIIAEKNIMKLSRILLSVKKSEMPFQ